MASPSSSQQGQVVQFCLPPGVCMVPCAPPLIRVREVPVIVRRIKYVDHIWEPDRQRPVISEDASESSDEGSQRTVGSRRSGSTYTSRSPKWRVTSKKKKASSKTSSKKKPSESEAKVMERARAGETAVRISGGYRTFGRDAMFRGKNMGLDDRVEDDSEEEELRWRRRQGGGARRSQDYEDEPLDYAAGDWAYSRQQPCPSTCCCCCCCCCCESERPRRSRRSRDETRSRLNVNQLISNLSNLTNDALADLAIASSSALAHMEDDKSQTPEHKKDLAFEAKVQAYRDRYRI